jgi:hypothetical protein
VAASAATLFCTENFRLPASANLARAETIFELAGSLLPARLVCLANALPQFNIPLFFLLPV